ncbi:hypothetical protein BZL29_1116 [Mycobacterium kansasii]|uniref:Uncharacterized protein n=1 Tax=Mycobacterium kansasii TaxID=1768 RepID=A0A1V3XZE0_MYCKA|nr:hypothetical protein BZL29_1116 [Mycobacterium kansasii]
MRIRVAAPGRVPPSSATTQPGFSDFRTPSPRSAIGPPARAHFVRICSDFPERGGVVRVRYGVGVRRNV